MPQAAQMAAMANTLASVEAVMEVAQYIATLPDNPKAPPSMETLLGVLTVSIKYLIILLNTLS